MADKAAVRREYLVACSWKGKAAEFSVVSAAAEDAWDDACATARKTCRARCGLPASSIQTVCYVGVAV